MVAPKFNLKTTQDRQDALKEEFAESFWNAGFVLQFKVSKILFSAQFSFDIDFL